MRKFLVPSIGDSPTVRIGGVVAHNVNAGGQVHHRRYAL